jgi:hypothetical protein
MYSVILQQTGDAYMSRRSRERGYRRHVRHGYFLSDDVSDSHFMSLDP